MIRVVLVDDEVLARIGIQSLIDGKEDITVTGVFSSAEDALEALQADAVDIVITDIEMTNMNGLEFIQQIRDKQLANGIIILSNHDDFRYAQEAISRGTDSYLLKCGITEETLIAEIKKIYEKKRKKGFAAESSERMFKPRKKLQKGWVYMVGILQANAREKESDNQFNDVMLAYLLEDILSRYEMGCYYSPFGKESFIVFQFDSHLSEEKRDSLLRENYDIITKNIEQYTSIRFVCGVSGSFWDEKEIFDRYREAEEALSMSFYDCNRNIFLYEMHVPVFHISFSAENFLESDGKKRFSRELTAIIQKARFDRASVKDLREELIQAINVLFYHVTQEYGFCQEKVQEWNFGARAISVITLSKGAEQLEDSLNKVVGEAHAVMLQEFDADGMLQVLRYIDQHLEEKITLNDLTEFSYMSVPSFSKKFKERTGMTLVQYLNVKRINRAKILLKNQNYSLQQVAEETGFSSANYLTRVFKKIEGQTVGDYRKKFGIMSTE
ncbi:MAG: response regulator [Clostridiales bacterium]|nr:response regulator [Clostridiales bacterium]